MTVRPRSVTRRGSILMVAGLLAAAGCAARRPQSVSIPRPLDLQTAVAVDKQGNEILAGSFAGRLRIAGAELVSAGGTDAFLAKTLNGAAVFPPMRFGGTGDDAATGVAVDDDGSIVVAGTFQGEATFGSQTLKAEVRHAGQRAVFVARFDPAGKLEWVKQIAVANLPTQVSVAVRPDHAILVGASGIGTVANRDGATDLKGESIQLDLLNPQGGFIPQADNVKVRALTVPVGCAHAPCAQGGALALGCGPDACVTEICNRDSFCCNVQWDGVCVSEVGSICHSRCDCGTICTPYPTLPDPFYPDACSCTAIVCGKDSWCAQQNWDSVCVSEAVNWCGIICH